MKARVIDYLAALPQRTLWLAAGGVLVLALLEGWFQIGRAHV